MSLHFNQILNRIPLRTVLTIPFVVQIFAVVGIVGYLSFRNGQMVVETLASQLRVELTSRILQQIEATVERPYVINQINANSFLRGDIDVNSEVGENQFWQQAQVFPSTNLIYCATEDEGAFLGVGRSQGGTGDSLQTYLANSQTNQHLYHYEIDVMGQRSFLRSKSTEVFDPRQRPWYQAAKQQGTSTWSQIYLDFQTFLPTLTANTPVYDSVSGKLLGICATDIILSEELNDFLKSLEIGKTGISFIVEPSGFLIASSTIEPTTIGEDENIQLIAARDSKNRLIQMTTRYLESRYQSLNEVISSQLGDRIDGSHHYIETVRFEDGYGLDWIIVLVVPEADFMAQIHENTRTTVILCLIAFAATLVIGLLITRWLSWPLRRLSAAAQEIGRGDWNTSIDLTRTDVIGDLSRSLASMTQQLQISFKELENRIDERTFDLVKANQELQLLSYIDGLTQVSNRRYFDRYFEQEWHRSARENEPLSLILCDVDYFKRYNDHYGHQAGDRCLQRIAQLLSRNLQRPGDLVARYGGEEFILLLSDTDTQGAVTVARNILNALREIKIPHAHSELQRISMSLGVAVATPGASITPDLLLAKTDLALYTAKGLGRDRYVVADTPHEPRMTSEE
ncbi:MAG: diguanylate cyclase [Cyanobacteria bacterium P01_H01_bin.153]